MCVDWQRSAKLVAVGRKRHEQLTHAWSYACCSSFATRSTFSAVRTVFSNNDTTMLNMLRQEAQLPQRNSASDAHVYLGWLTDRAMHRTLQNRNTALCTVVHRAVKRPHISRYLRNDAALNEKLPILGAPLRFSAS